MFCGLKGRLKTTGNPPLAHCVAPDSESIAEQATTTADVKGSSKLAQTRQSSRYSDPEITLDFPAPMKRTGTILLKSTIDKACLNRGFAASTGDALATRLLSGIGGAEDRGSAN